MVDVLALSSQTFAKDGALTNITALCSTIQVNKATSDFKVEIGDGTSRIFIQYKGIWKIVDW